jgi:beta-glucosidase
MLAAPTGLFAVSCSGRVRLKLSPQTSPAPAKPLVKFPDGFSRGVATSAYQIQGVVAADGAGRSTWDEFYERPGMIADCSS